MSLTMLPLGKEAFINDCRAREATRKFLEGLGIIPGTPVCVISEMDGNLILSIKGTRLAVNKGIAQQVTVKV
jgi:ferrous iron transport protein A